MHGDLTEPQTMSIVEVLQTVDGGGALDDLRNAINDVTRAVIGTGKDGTVTLSLKISRMSDRQVAIRDAVSAKVPNRDKDQTIFYATDDGDLTRKDPRQLSMFEGTR